MAIETLTQRDVDAAIARLSNVQGILTCAFKVLDEEVTGSPLWEVSEAIQAAASLVSESYCALNNNNVVVTVREA